MKPKLQLTPKQLIAVMLIENHEQQLQIAANQLGGFLEMKHEADILLDAQAALQRGRVALLQRWENKIQVVDAIGTPVDVKTVIPSVLP